jgi:hypothetical protein
MLQIKGLYFLMYGGKGCHKLLFHFVTCCMDT